MKTYRYMIGMLLCVWLLAACDNSNAFDEYAKFDTTAQTAWGQSIVDGSNGYVAHVKSDRTYNLADGVDVLEMAFLADDGLAMQLFLFKIALSDKITLRTTLADDKNQVGTGQTIMKQLEAMQKNGKKVLGGTNADFFNTTTYIPYGVCYRDGVAVKTSFSRTDCNVFVITKDNRACCFTEEEYALHKDIVREAVCGRSTLLLKNGEQLDQSGNTMPVANMEPRTAIGATADGKLILLVCDGRNMRGSAGFTLAELADKLIALGAVDAVNLDGGGSSTMVGSDGKVLNRPSDTGSAEVIVERKISTAVVISEVN